MDLNLIDQHEHILERMDELGEEDNFYQVGLNLCFEFDRNVDPNYKLSDEELKQGYRFGPPEVPPAKTGDQIFNELVAELVYDHPPAADIGLDREEIIKMRGLYKIKTSMEI